MSDRADQLADEIRPLMDRYESIVYRYEPPTPAEREEADAIRARIQALYDELDQLPRAEYVYVPSRELSVHTKSAVVLALAYATAFSPLLLALLGVSLLWMLLPLPIGAVLVVGLMWMWDW